MKAPPTDSAQPLLLALDTLNDTERDNSLHGMRDGLQVLVDFA